MESMKRWEGGPLLRDLPFSGVEMLPLPIGRYLLENRQLLQDLRTLKVHQHHLSTFRIP
jgi:hypothetical protein